MATARGTKTETKGEEVRKGSEGLQQLTKTSSSSSNGNGSRSCGRDCGRGGYGAANSSASSRLVKAGNGGTSGNAQRLALGSGALSLARPRAQACRESDGTVLDLRPPTLTQMRLESQENCCR